MYRPDRNRRMKLIKFLSKLGILSAQHQVAMYGILRAQMSATSSTGGH